MENLRKPGTLRWLLIILFLLVPSSAFGEIEGTFQGRIAVGDVRPVRPASTVSDPGVAANIVSVRRAIVSVSVIPPGTTDTEEGCCVAAPQTFWTQTDDNGNFEILWRDTLRDNYPTRLRIIVHWFSTTGGIIRDTRLTPPANIAFEIQGPGGESLNQSFEIGAVTADPGQRILFTASVTDESQAYLTVLEVYRRIVRWSDRLETRMHDVAVRTRVPGFGSTFGVSPLRDLALVSEMTPLTAPQTVAHELGHVITWNALKVNEARVTPVDYGPPDFQWHRHTRETDRVAFLEGIADFWSLAWEFDMEDGSGTVFRIIGPRTFNFELGRVTAGPALNCRNATTANRHEFPFCHTVTIWDLWDRNGSDGVRMSIANIVNTLNRFPNGCANNGCTEEPGPGGLNHHDFRRRIPSTQRGAATAVYRSNGLGGGWP